MTKEITNARILQELEDKFTLRDFENERFLFSETVIPTYEIGQHFRRPSVMSDTESITATGAVVFFIVPRDEKWFLHRYNIIFVTGSYKVAGAMITRPLIANYIYLDLTKNQTVSYAVDLPKSVELFPGEFIRIYVDDYTSTGDLLMIADVTVEHIR